MADNCRDLPLSLSPAAARMRRYRERRRRNLRCILVLLRTSEIEALVGRGFLQAESRNSESAIRDALYQFLDRALGQRR